MTSIDVNLFGNQNARKAKQELMERKKKARDGSTSPLSPFKSFKLKKELNDFSSIQIKKLYDDENITPAVKK